MFRNEPLRDFTEAHNRTAVSEALQALESRLSYNLLVARPIINGEHLSGGEEYLRSDPSNTNILVSKAFFAGPDLVERAIGSCRSGLENWGFGDAGRRIGCLRELAAILRRDKNFLTALIIREAGKTWKEADGDVAETIDFCEYYAMHAERMAKAILTEEVAGEDNIYFYQPRGIAAVIAPWNFPLAIACGMTVAALVTGNTVILKPSEQTSGIAYELAIRILEAGVPSNAFAFLPGRGEVIGQMMVDHPDIDMYVFTGSKPVGLQIVQNAGVTKEGQRGIKRVIAELGGKNAIVVDSDADIDDAIRGILNSAFGYAGQKCSACSRVIAVGDSYERLLERIANAASDLIVGEAQNPASFLGPVIDQESRERILTTIASAKAVLPLVVQCPVSEELMQKGHYVPPTIFKDVPSHHPIWTDELFGPVVAFQKANSFEEAVASAVKSKYALTGGVFSRSPSNIEYARKHFRVGNLYINRGCTGALVGRQPFGGFCFSGIGSKAGGPDYLLQFVEPRTISENTMRRGFAPGMG